MSSLDDDDGADEQCVKSVNVQKKMPFYFLKMHRTEYPHVKHTHITCFHEKRKHGAGDTEILHDKDTSGGNTVE